MSSKLKISVGQYSGKGRKEVNQDFHGICVPEEPLLTSKGIAVALADGISSSDVGHIASEACITGFLEDYYCTSDAWSAKKSVQRVLAATNSWLYSQSLQGQHRYDKNRGYVCTFSAVVIKSTTVHLFHVGDARIYRLRGNILEQLTTDHRLWVSQDKSYLSRAMGINAHLEIDYKTVQANAGDIFLLTTDGIYESITDQIMAATLNERADKLDSAAKAIAELAYEQGSTDNLTAQVIRIDELPASNAEEIYQQLTQLPFPPILEPRTVFDGYKIIRELHASSRSHVYLAHDIDTGTQVIIKTPSIDLQGDPAYLERFLLEEWIARRINSAHVLRPCEQTRQRHFIYLVTEYISGQTLAQWIIDNPEPELETVRTIVEQIAQGLRAFHRLEMIHQDLKPDNIMIDNVGTVKIIDFGSTRVAGVVEVSTPIQHNSLLGTAQYTAPEYLLGENGSPCSDLFSLAVITYQMLTGKLPYGTQVAKARTKTAQKKLHYIPLPDDDRELPRWINSALRKALNPDPFARYPVISEFLYDLRHPNKQFLDETRVPLIERDPVFVWKGLCLLQLGIIVALLAYIA
ncbi:MAG: bifunctional protein-serine/threonine kinase/phosphatase [Granulosicoccus sp.]